MENDFIRYHHCTWVTMTWSPIEWTPVYPAQSICLVPADANYEGRVVWYY